MKRALAFLGILLLPLASATGEALLKIDISNPASVVITSTEGFSAGASDANSTYGNGISLAEFFTLPAILGTSLSGDLKPSGTLYPFTAAQAPFVTDLYLTSLAYPEKLMLFVPGDRALAGAATVNMESVSTSLPESEPPAIFTSGSRRPLLGLAKSFRNRPPLRSPEWG